MRFRRVSGAIWAVCMALGVMGLAAPAHAQTVFSYQGKLDEAGLPVAGPVDLAFRLYDAAANGTQIGSQNTFSNFSGFDDDGLFTVELDFGGAAFTGADRWLEVWVDGAPLSPRQQIRAAPYAIHSLNGGTNGWTDKGLETHTLDNVGIGTTSPSLSNLHVVASPGQWGIRAIGDIHGNTAITAVNGGGSGSSPAISGQSTSTHVSAKAIQGLLSGTTPGAQAAGVKGIVSSTTSDDGYGVYGIHNGSGYGVFGEALNTNAGVGVRGLGWWGVYGVANSTTGFGGVFAGNGFLGAGPSLLVWGDSTFGGGLKVGAGGAFTDPPLAKIHVDNGTDAGLGGGGYILVGALDDLNIAIDSNEIMARNNGAGSTLLLNREGGNVAIGSASGGTSTLSTPVLAITGGADFSEQFDVAEFDGVAPEPGMVVSIDPDHPGRLIPSTQAYDPTVAGVISGAGGVATGMLMGHEGTIADGEHPVALSGRVYCFVDATERAVVPGDMLTTSNTPGHAMKAADRDRAYGAVIGKAMTGLERGETGLVLVLINLQ